MTREELYHALYEKQEGKCWLCQKHSSTWGIRRLCMDHNHATGEWRGLLCSYCNRYLVGKFKDPVLVRRIAEYLEQGRTGYFKEKRKRRKRKKK